MGWGVVLCFGEEGVSVGGVGGGLALCCACVLGGSAALSIQSSPRLRHNNRPPPTQTNKQTNKQTKQGATKAAHALNGRWFAGRMVSVEYLTEAGYKEKCPDAPLE